MTHSSTSDQSASEPKTTRRSRPLTGIEWVVDALDCVPAKLRDESVIRAICHDILSELQLTVVGEPQVCKFPGPGGVTAMYLLSESHLACHTYPEISVATFNLYCCGERDPWPWQDELRERIGAREVSVRQLLRGDRSQGDRSQS